MKKLAPFIIIFAISCCTSHKNVPGKTVSTVITDTTIVYTEPDAMKGATQVKNNAGDKSKIENKNSKDTVAGKEQTNSTAGRKNESSNDKENIKGLPSCMVKLIAKFKQEDVQNPPRKIFSYTYYGATVYYVSPPCCDFFSDLYDSNCKIIAHPDGGITGRGDGRAKDFVKLRTNEKLVWEDLRK